MGESLSSDPLHDQAEEVALLHHIVNGDDARVRQSGGGAGFAGEALPEGVAFGGIGKIAELEGFDDDFAAEDGIVGAEDDAHAAAAELAQDAITSDIVHGVYSPMIRSVPGTRGNR